MFCAIAAGGVYRRILWFAWWIDWIFGGLLLLLAIVYTKFLLFT